MFHSSQVPVVDLTKWKVDDLARSEVTGRVYRILSLTPEVQLEVIETCKCDKASVGKIFNDAAGILSHSKRL